MNKRLFSLLLALVLCLSLAPMAALVDEPPTSLNNVSFAERDGNEPTPTGPYRDGSDYVLTAGSYQLTDDFTLTGGALWIKDEVTIDLNGHTLKRTGNGLVIAVGFYLGNNSYATGSLTLKDSGTGGTVEGQTTSNSTIAVNQGSAFTLINGTVCGGIQALGIDPQATATLKGGTVGKVSISNNGTLYAESGTVTGAVDNQGTITCAEGATAATTFAATTFNDNVVNGGAIEWGTFKVEVENCNRASISGGVFYGTVSNAPDTREEPPTWHWPTISGGEFHGAVQVNCWSGSTLYYMPSTYITGGTFCENFVGGDGNTFQSYTVTFQKNDGTENVHATRYVVTGNKVQGAAVPTREDGSSFSGWYEKENGAFKETAFDFDTAITADTTLYARWVCAEEHTGGTATCKAKAKCEACGEEYGDVDAANHTALNHVEPKAATTEAEGNIEYWCCGDCGKCFSDKGGETEIALADTVLAKLAPTPTPAPTAKAQAPNTGDEASVALWLVLATVSVFGAAVVGRKKVK